MALVGEQSGGQQPDIEVNGLMFVKVKTNEQLTRAYNSILIL